MYILCYAKTSNCELLSMFPKLYSLDIWVNIKRLFQRRRLVMPLPILIHILIVGQTRSVFTFFCFHLLFLIVFKYLKTNMLYYTSIHICISFMFSLWFQQFFSNLVFFFLDFNPFFFDFSNAWIYKTLPRPPLRAISCWP